MNFDWKPKNLLQIFKFSKNVTSKLDMRPRQKKVLSLTTSFVKMLTRGLSFESIPKDRDSTWSRKYGNSPPCTFQS